MRMPILIRRHFTPLARQVALGLGVFADLQSLWNYRTCLNRAHRGQPPLPLRIRALHGKPVWCRPGTTDTTMLWTTFFHQYHLPAGALAPDAVIVDAGANVGYTMAHFASLWPTARIVGIEMDEGNCRMARRNVEPFGSRCQVIQAAIWSHPGPIGYCGMGESGLHVGETNPSGPATLGGTVQAQTLDALLDHAEIDRVDYLKMDIEGAEAEIFKEPADWMAVIDRINLEVHPPASMDWCAGQLDRFGFDCLPDPTGMAGLLARKRN